MKLRLTLLWVMFVFCLVQAEANNVRIADKVKVAGRLGQDTIILSFPLKWDNSWRLDENWDAVYLFIKYKRIDVEEPWRHLCVKNDGHRVDAGYSWSLAQAQDGTVSSQSGPSNVGLFIARNTTGAGAASTMVRVAVDITKGDLQPYYKASYEDFRDGKIDISVAAIEMVFIPRGPYYLGDGISYDTFGDEAGSPYLVTSNDSLTLRVKNGTAQELRKGVVGVRKNYPKAYEGFYCMKYELSQEQYVYFLNKLPYKEQKKRIGNKLDEMSPGDYAFGDKTYADARNGIILEKRRTKGLGNIAVGDTAVIFGHNLNQDDGYNSPKDGKTVACNFLTPEDAKVYADWVGLRLMTELEYEKTCRLRNPSAPPTGFQYAWNGMTVTQPAGGLQSGTEGTVDEVAAGAPNANVGSVFNGPMRCGSFARAGTTNMSATGASYWGAMDLTGNLSEMECNAVEGRMMSAVDGDGSLASEVITWERDTLMNWFGTVGVPPYTAKVMVRRQLGTKYNDRWGNKIVIIDSFPIATNVQKLPYSQGYSVWRRLKLPSLAWPDTLAAYGVKGGSFKDKDRDYLAVSARKEYNLFKSGVNVNPALSQCPRLPYVTFRLIKTMPMQQVKAGRIGLQNNEFKDTSVVCATVPYTIKELDAGSGAATTILYEWEENDGSGWRKLEGEIKQTLTLTQHWNADTVLKSREYRRKSITPVGEGYSNTVTLTLVGHPKFKPLQGVIDFCNKSVAITGRVDVPVDSILWFRTDNQLALGTKVTHTASSVYLPNRTDFPNPGSYQIVCKAYKDGCPVEGFAYTNVEAPIGGGDCNSPVIDEDGNEYQAAILADCRCWLLEPLKRVTIASQVSPDGIRMYNWDDLNSEPHSYNKDGNTSMLCPPGFYIPTKAEVDVLIENLSDGVAPEQIKGLQPYGYLDNLGDHIPGGYYWVLVYSDLLEQQIQVTSWVMRVNAGDKLETVQEVWDVDGEPIPAQSDMYFPVRCIKEKPKN